MNILKKKSTSAFLILGASIWVNSLLASRPVHAQQAMPVCPANPGLYADKAAFGTAFNQGCRGTPSSYGVTVYKMGFCSSNPLAGGAGVAVDYSSCSIIFDNSAGSSVSFSAGETLSLPASSSSFPDVGNYGFAIIELAPTFEIADSIGPFADGNTYYSTTTLAGAGGSGSVSSTASGSEVAASIPLNTFGNNCTATGTDTVAGTTLTGALLDSSDQLIANNAGIAQCTGISKLLGVAQLAAAVDITSATTGLTATFTVTNNGSTIYCSNGTCDDIIIDSGPFSVVFTVVE